MKKFLAGILLVIVAFVVHVLISTGYFRSVENRFDGEVFARIPIKGAEDLTISYEDQFMIISADDRSSQDKSRESGLYYLSLSDTTDLTPKLISAHLPFDFFPHGISLQKIDSSIHQLLVVNHPTRESSTIERFSLFGDSLVHIETLSHEQLFSANDVTIIDQSRFYVTNDHGNRRGFKRILEDYMGIPSSYVMLYDGNAFTKVAHDIAYANGIHYAVADQKLLVAAPRAFEVKVYNVEENFQLSHLQNIDCGTGVDNIEVDQNGRFWIGCHPNLLAFTAYAKGSNEIAPSEVIYLDENLKPVSVFVDEGQLVSASTAAAPFQDLLFVGNVKDNHLLIMKGDF